MVIFETFLVFFFQCFFGHLKQLLLKNEEKLMGKDKV